MKLPFTTLDVFTTTRYSGNPLAIVRVPATLKEELGEEQKQRIATEFNLSETVFLHEAAEEATEEDRRSATVADYDIFGARIRIPFAGHPTIGTAIYVMKHARSAFPAVRTLRTPLAGEVPVRYEHESQLASVSVPHALHFHEQRLPHPLPDTKTNPSGTETVPLVSIVRGMTFALVPLSTLDALGSVSAGLVPAADVYRGLHLDPGWNVGVTSTLYYCELREPLEGEKGEPGTRLIRTRNIGRIEDPGTGSASSALCAYLALLEPLAAGGSSFAFHLVQGVEMGRRCDIWVGVTKTAGENSIDKIDLMGKALPVMEGTLEV